MKLPLLLLGLAILRPGAADRPNIIFCMADDMGYGDVGYNGNTIIQTPELDAMAAETLRMPYFHSAAPNCSPTRAASLTGRAHYRTGLSNHSQPIDATEITVADALASVGYRTGHFGKWHLGEVDATSPNPGDLGFDTWRATRNNEVKVDPANFHRDGRDEGNLEGEASAVLMDMALAFIEDAARDRQPFYVNIWFHTPHTPYGSTPDYLDLYAGRGFTDQEQQYYAMMTALDAQMGRLRRELRRMGIADNTLLVFTSDNGPVGPGSSGGLAGGKNSMKEGGTRVSALFEWPDELPSGAVNTRIASSHDLYPTFLAAAGLSSFGPARTIDGENLLPHLKSGNAVRPGPIRFYHSGRPKVVLPDGSNIENPSAAEDPGYADWLSDVQNDYSTAQARIAQQLNSVQPIVDAGTDLIVVEDSDGNGSGTVTLDASGSTDADGAPATYTWWWRNNRTSGISPTLTLPPGAHEIHLRVEDDAGVTDDDSVSVFVRGKQDGISPHVESGGRIVIEAEHYGWKHRRRSPVEWVLDKQQAGSAGEGCMALPNRRSEVAQNWTDPGATLYYPLKITQAGTYRLWLRRNVPDGDSINVNIGVDGAEVVNKADNQNAQHGSWVWIEAGAVPLPSGMPVLMIRQRQDGYRIDRMVLTLDHTFTPSGQGPAESAREGDHDFGAYMDGYPSISGDDALPGGDPDEDGIVNELEFALGLDADTPDAEGRPGFSWIQVDGRRVLRLTHRQRLAHPGELGTVRGYEWLAAPTLLSPDWRAVDESGLGTATEPGLPVRLGPDLEEVVTHIDPASELSTPAFFRLNISQ